ncbi:hypothetical protein T310_6144 [Rasamsonia emersonii CBS 393.64]|uniref:Xylanolytic transcriptional activator regulatory domain-containing protein n=1 Tax=Rasamsonia emersonii (strain ATCC 16479 / CBS 393.64 / IMI 116815) TaxID=1408163 RepID=A0A0F4YP42_RASE3|nr:hypothetical protein T310_6144 [Rasamsonia emersonii CBS 393.64]KKA19860.1 hypothetical protein T310_6144 [Rasamsonia emersonii CBS 393.64]
MEARKARRRVPQELRKRAQLSCDSCRKCDTLRHDLPAKARLYGSVETISDRLRCLEAIVKGAFPDEPISTIPDLLALGRRKGYAMPEVSTVSNQNDLDNSALRQLPAENESASRQKPVQYRDTPRLVQDPSGRSHYIGPSGSLSFFAELRELVSERHPSSRFASDNVAEALEARSEPLNGNSPHPANESHPQLAASSPATSSAGEALRSASCLRNVPLGTLNGLLRLYFENVHADFPLFHRAMFQDEFERYFLSRQDPRSQLRADSEPDDGWLVCLHMMVAFGCVLQRTLPGNDSVNYALLQSECWNVSRAALPRLTTMCVQSHVQALLLIALYLHSINERNASWVLAGCAARIAVAIGLHRKELHGSFPLIERETRKRIWCTLYGFEQFLCLSLGRPSAVDDDEVDASAPSDDMMSSSNGPPGYTECNFQLQQLSSRLRRTMSVHSRRTITPKAMLNDLKAWEDGLPPHLVLSKGLLEQAVPAAGPELVVQYCSQYPVHHLRSIILLHVQYHSLVILATRPYLLMLISSSSKSPASMPYPWDESTEETSANEITLLARSCVSSASRLATLILILDWCRILNGLTWLDVFYAYSAAMVLLLRILWIPHPSAGRHELEREEALKRRANTLVTEVRRALKSVPKSSTMQRFASVVENFADAVTANSSSSSSDDNNNNNNTGETRPDFAGHTFPADNNHNHNNTSTSTALPIDGVSVDTTNNNKIPASASASTYDNTEPDDALTEAARVISSFSDEALPTAAGTSFLWNDSSMQLQLQSLTQHIVDWNDFERFLGGFGEY